MFGEDGLFPLIWMFVKIIRVWSKYRWNACKSEIATKEKENGVKDAQIKNLNADLAK